MGGTFGSPEELKERGYNKFCAKLFCPGFFNNMKVGYHAGPALGEPSLKLGPW
jgi:hypothetical protein